jgi:hypothetical protein
LHQQLFSILHPFQFFFSNFLFGWLWTLSNLHALFFFVLKLNVKGIKSISKCKSLHFKRCRLLLSFEIKTFIFIRNIQNLILSMNNLDILINTLRYPTILAVLVNKQSNIPYHGQSKGKIPMMVVFFFSTLYLSFILLNLSLHWAQIHYTSFGKWLFTLTNIFKFCFLIGILLNSQYLSSNLLNKKQMLHYSIISLRSLSLFSLL